MMGPLRIVGITAVVGVTLLTAACSSNDTESSRRSQNSTLSTLPLQFDATDGITVPSDDPKSLHKNFLYSADGKELSVMDVSTGEVVNTFAPHESEEYRETGHPVLAPPYITQQSDEVRVTSIFLTKREHKEPAKAVVLSVNKSGTEVVNRVEIPIKGTENKYNLTHDFKPLHVDSNIAVFSVDISDDNGVAYRTYGIDLKQNKVAWSIDNFWAKTLSHNMMIGKFSKQGSNNERYNLAALSLKDRKEKWSIEIPASLAYVNRNFRFTDLPDERFLIQEPTDNGRKLRVFSTQTGKEEKTTFRITHPIETCKSAAETYLVCWQGFGKRGAADSAVTVFDHTTGKRIWTLNEETDDEKAVATTAITDTHIYGRSTNYPYDPVVLNIADSSVAETDPGIAPFIIGTQYAVALDDNDVARVYPARQ